ncbi:hypothetical protein LIER_08866 [Lithospermum erythrorhizon]|uniref:Integrase catalytic domain-containing protein n=1 Tax=Lithospermum erythrorhizon TaxID=34254 RepID=A0AAV3PDR6_LITER
MQWIRKETVVSHVVFTSLKATAWTGWYFDSGCSRHMTGNRSNLTSIKEVKTDFVTFGGGEKGKIIGKGRTHSRKEIQREKEDNILVIRSDHGREFENFKFQTFCDEEGIKHEYSTPITPQQNGIVERKNRTLQEMARVMIHAKQLPIKLWAEAVNTACHIHNHLTLRPGTHSSSYELWRGRKPNVHYLHIFGSVCYILTDREPRQKFDVRSDEGIFLGYSRNSRALRVYNKRTRMVMKSINVKVMDQDASMVDEEDISPTVNPSVTHSQSSEETNKKPNDNDSGIEPAARIEKNHPVEYIIGDLDQGMTMRKKDKVDYRKMAGLLGETCCISKVEPKDVKAALLNEYWIIAMQEELIQFDKNDVWELVPRPPGCNIIGTKWISKKMSPEMLQKTKRAIRLLLSIAYLLKFKVFQMDVKSAFLNGVVQEEVYVEQPKGFIDVQHPEHVYKLKKALYGLKQAP